MQNIIKEIERMLHSSVVFYPDAQKNVAGSFKVVFPEIYYDKFRELDEKQKEVLSKFIKIFYKKLYEIEEYNNKILNEGVLNFEKDKKILLNKQNIMNYFIEYFGQYVNAYTDIILDENCPYYALIKNNEIGVAKYKTLLGKKYEVNGLKYAVYLKINSKYIPIVEKFRKEHSLALKIFPATKEFTLYYAFDIFDGDVTYIKNMDNEQIEKYFKGSKII